MGQLEKKKKTQTITVNFYICATIKVSGETK